MITLREEFLIKNIENKYLMEKERLYLDYRTRLKNLEYEYNRKFGESASRDKLNNLRISLFEDYKQKESNLDNDYLNQLKHEMTMK